MKNRGFWEVLEQIRNTNKDGHSYIPVNLRELQSEKTFRSLFKTLYRKLCSWNNI